MSPLAATTVDLAPLQFATTSIYHFLFVPLTLGLGPIVAVMQTNVLTKLASNDADFDRVPGITRYGVI